MAKEKFFQSPLDVYCDWLVLSKKKKTQETSKSWVKEAPLKTASFKSARPAGSTSSVRLRQTKRKAFVDLETTSKNESPSPRKSVPKQPTRSGGVVIRDHIVRKTPIEQEFLFQPKKGRKLRRSQTAFGALLHIGSSSPAHAPTYLQDLLSAVSKAKISHVETAGDFYDDAVVEEMAGDNPPTEANPTDDSEVPVEIVPEDVFLQYFGSLDIAPVPSSPVGIHRERVDESLAKGIPTSKEEFHALRASLFRLLKETKDSPILAATYNDMDLALNDLALVLNDLFALHKMTKDSHDKAVASLQHLGSLRKRRNTFRLLSMRLAQATPTLYASFSEVASGGTYSSVMANPLPVDPVAQLLANILMELQSEGIAASVTQEVLPAA
ncbi:hypothetical protein K7X08_001012 [Anisodus acutangulus]|uniref:Uncharacterized protein n=1 Tax=Anisodus acutangulus TaxID=402998 RepID=A0A9Q1MMX7_9SOLA|nr:hypothetical protein K7X08_001012 [Anisodus acutangulus]